MKRILLLFSALMLSITALWAHDVEIDGIYYNLDEENKTAEVTYAGKKPSSIFSGYIGKYEIPSIINYEAKDYIVTSIGDSTFYDCTELTSIKMPNTITSIGDAAFYGCVNLENESYISNIPAIPGPGIPGMGTIRFFIDATAVDACYGIGIEGAFNRWNVFEPLQGTEFAENMFYIDIPSMTAEEFGNAKILLLLADGTSAWDYEVASSGYDITGSEDYITLINDYGTLNAINLVDDNIDNVVIKIAILAVNNTPCEDVVPAASTEIEERSASIINEEEQNTENISTFIIPNSVKYIGEYAFYNCQSIKSIEIGNSVTSIGSQAFYGCDGLKKVNYLGTIDEWVEIDFIKYQSNPTEYAKDLYINNELVTDVKITSADSIKRRAFIYCKSIKTLEIGNSVTSIGDYAFYRCSSLASASIGENVTDMGEIIFYECNNLKNITAYPTKVPTINYYESSAQYEFGTYIAKLYVPCEALEDYELDNVFGQFKYIRCIEEEEETPEDVKIEVDDNGNVNIKWPPTEGANSYKLVVSHAGNVICTLQFNSKGQLTSIDLGKRSASVGFEFTVTGLSQGSKYSYEMTALSEVNEVLDYYAGAFITNGYKEDDDVTTSINESITDANITVSGGKISADADFSIYNTIGLDVTAFNGSLQPGVYLVSIENNIVKVMIK